jgi:salicylate hydroxylase
MGGLGTALALAKKGFKHIDLFETASNLGFVGAGIQMAPNMVRILDRLGCWEDIEKVSTKVTGSSIRRKFKATRGYPVYFGHWTDAKAVG